MKILWVVNHLIPPIANKLKEETNTSGSWLIELLDRIKKEKSIDLFVVCPYYENRTEVVDGVTYFLIKTTSYDKFISPSKNYQKKVDEILKLSKPNLIHLHGSEFAFNRAFLNVNNIPTVLSIQGLISEISKKEYSFAKINDYHFKKYGGISLYFVELVKYIRNKFRSISERKIIESVDNIIGRTEWDHAHSYFINKNSNYYQCQETIREDFFDIQWDTSTFERNTIFCAGGFSNPIKGFHIIIQAVAMIAAEFQDIQIKVVGENIFEKKRINSYEKLILKLIKACDLEENVQFLGKLNSTQMAKEFKKANIYVMGSSIENSSNTLAEAMCIGTPSIIPLVGGNLSLSTDNVDSLYFRFGDIEHLSWNIKKVLNDTNIATTLSNNSIERSKKQYNNEKSFNTMINIYHSILNY